MKIINLQDREDRIIDILFSIWKKSVKATHLFLSDSEIEQIAPYVPMALKNIKTLLVAVEDEKYLGFMGINKNKIEMLFLHPEMRGKGIGKKFIDYGVENFNIDKVCVNEQNPEAFKFYEKMGFITYKRSEIDEQGNPYPILFMKLSKKNENEVVNNLLNKNLKIIQRNDYFNFSLDSLLISNFISLGKGVNKIVDLGTGNGAIPLFLSERTKAKITGLELQKVSADLAKRNIEINGLDEQIKIINDDMKNWKKYFNHGSQDAVITNPPFFKFNGNEEFLNDLDQLTLARHEITITLEEIIQVASCLLKDKGYFAMVHRPDRILEILDLMRKYGISPKKLRFCHTKIDKQAKILLIEGIKFGKNSMTILPPLIAHDDDGKYSKEILQMFEPIK